MGRVLRGCGGYTLLEILIVMALISLLAAILIGVAGKASLYGAKSVVCAARQRTALMGWSAYAATWHGCWPAAWDTGSFDPDDPMRVSTQLPFIMWYYTQGACPPGPAYTSGEGWWNIETDQYDGFDLMGPEITPQLNPAYQCSEIERLGPTANPNWYAITSYSAFVYSDVPEPLRHHARQDWIAKPSSTGVLMCLSGMSDEGKTTGWCDAGGVRQNPHDEKSNLAFADGHVEKFDEKQLAPRMWELRYEKGRLRRPSATE